MCVACVALNQFLSILDALQDPMAFGCSRCNAQLKSKWLCAENAHTSSSKEESFVVLATFSSLFLESFNFLLKGNWHLLTSVQTPHGWNISSLFSTLWCIQCLVCIVQSCTYFQRINCRMCRMCKECLVFTTFITLLYICEIILFE